MRERNGSEVIGSIAEEPVNICCHGVVAGGKRRGLLSVRPKRAQRKTAVVGMKVVGIDQKLICILAAGLAQDGGTLACKGPGLVDGLRRWDQIGSIRKPEVEELQCYGVDI